MKTFIFNTAKKLLSYWASKLLGAEAVTEVLICLADAHAKNTATKTDDRLVAIVKKYLDGSSPR